MAIQRKLYRVGVDVGGTNTDSALACLSPESSQGKVQIIASSKSQTTADVTTGICNAVRDVLDSAQVPRQDVLSINCGTTAFINACIQGDPRLSRVAVLRLCGPFCREVPPFSDFPPRLRAAIEGHFAYVSGGLEIDGRYISTISETEIIEQAHQIKAKGISAVVVVGVFSPLDTAETTQEGEVRDILRKIIPGVDVVCSRDIGRVGLLERENASILNASILKFGRQTIRSFESAMLDLGLNCPLYLTQNDGTVMDAQTATITPIKTFSSGATNSLIGAVFLAGLQDKSSDVDLKSSQVIMVDIGGTTSDFAALSPSGFPRQSPAVVSIAGVRTAFSMPEVHSIGLGGGSHVTVSESGRVSVGPISVGSNLHTESRCFGGQTLTATDIVVSRGLAGDSLPSHEVEISRGIIDKASHDITRQLHKGIDLMKTSDLDVILLLVGGGSIIQMDKLENVTRCIRPPFFDVANAVGAAIAKVAGEVDSIVIPGDKSQLEILKEAKAQAVELAYENGALHGSVKIVEVETIPLQYVTNHAVRVIVKAVGDLGWQSTPKLKTNGEAKLISKLTINEIEIPEDTDLIKKSIDTAETQEIDLETYEPEVSASTGEWFVSETDLLFMGEGCGILGTGGGGSVYTSYLHALEILRNEGKQKMRIVSPESLPSNSNTMAIAFAGAPSVSNERLISGDELQFAAESLSRFLNIPGVDGIMGAEIGGSNGMRAFATAAKMNVPVVDTDTMGRAFPKVDMALPYVYDKATPCPSVLSDARGNVQIIASVENAHRFETVIRSACVELGLFTALSLAPYSTDVVKNYCCSGSLSFAWFMGRAICLARKKKNDVVQSLLSVIPGGVLLYTGKIINVAREVKGGWTIGTATLEPFHDETDEESPLSSDERPLLLGYQNEFLHASLQNPDGSMTPLCTTPNLITALDQDGSALATHEMRYGLRISVIAMPAHPLWMTSEGMNAAGPESFGLDISYKGLDTQWAEPVSVIERFQKRSV